MSYSSYLAAMGILFGAVMKMFPFFGISILLKETRNKFLWLTGICTLLFLVYFVQTLESAAIAWNRTMRGGEISYGAGVFLDRYHETASQSLSQLFSDPEPLLKYGSIVIAVLLIVTAGILGLTWQQSLISASERNMVAFRMGASIYIGTFLLGNNWDYRLAFLVFVVPQLMEWIRSSHGKLRWVVRLCLVSLTLSCWHFIAWFARLIASKSGLYEGTFILDEFVNWILMVTLAYLLFISLPDWVKASLQRAVPKSRLAPTP